MTNSRKPWLFYGREEMKKDLGSSLQLEISKKNRIFLSIRVVGQRWIGKTKLLLQMKDMAPPDMPFIIYEMPDPTKTDITKVIAELLEVGERKGLQDMSRDYYNSSVEEVNFQKILLNMFRQGTTVVLDEFHNADGYGLASYIKLAIDEAWDKKPLYPGKLVMMGSHQQKVLAMFMADQPLYGRDKIYYHVRQWCLETTIKVAKEHGLLHDFNKFLTLWTAYGGIPNEWENFCVLPQYAPLHKGGNFSNFIEWQR